MGEGVKLGVRLRVLLGVKLGVKLGREEQEEGVTVGETLREATYASLSYGVFWKRNCRCISYFERQNLSCKDFESAIKFRYTPVLTH